LKDHAVTTLYSATTRHHFAGVRSYTILLDTTSTDPEGGQPTGYGLDQCLSRTSLGSTAALRRADASCA
ncbi:hypothetical protein ACWDSJ_24985, partial [Nocardia sp. NPDC003482]